MLVARLPLLPSVASFICWCTKAFIWMRLTACFGQGINKSTKSSHKERNYYTCRKDSLHYDKPIGSDVEWVRPLSYVETFMTQAQKYGSMKTAYALWLDTNEPINLTLVKKAGRLIYKKMPHLQLSVGYHNNCSWWKKRTSQQLDIEEVSSDDVISVMEANLKHHYNLEDGPLWFIRFVKCKHNHENVYGYKYALVFGFLHNITDGTTNIEFCNLFISLLNDLIDHHPANMSAEGVFAEPLEDRLAVEKSSKFYMCEFFIERVKKILCRSADVQNFSKNYPLTVESEASTRILHHEIDEITTERLLKKCKVEKVTLNSAFMAAANLGLYKLILEKDVNIKDTVINTLQSVNMRRYWPKDARPKSFGCRISTLNLSFNVSQNDFCSFWEYARKVHSSIKVGLDDKPLAILGLPLAEFVSNIIRANFWLSKLSLPSSNDCHFCVTNMGNLDNILLQTQAHIKVSQITRSVSGHFMPTLCQHTLQTFRGRFCYSIDYYTQKMKESTAEKYSNYILDILKESIDKAK